MSRIARAYKHRSMNKTSKVCSICGNAMYITLLTKKLFCRNCWAYTKPQTKLDDIKQLFNSI